MRVLAVVNNQLESGASVVVWTAQTTQTHSRVEGHLVVWLRTNATHRAEDFHQVVEAFDFLNGNQNSPEQKRVKYGLVYFVDVLHVLAEDDRFEEIRSHVSVALQEILVDHRHDVIVPRTCQHMFECT